MTTDWKTFRTRGFAVLGSYGLCCVLLFCLFILTIQGTLYQVDHGLYAAKKRFFESWFVWVEFGGLSVPTFPGGVTCMGLLSVNMIVGGFWRRRITVRNIGVVIVHLGIAFMLVAGMVKMIAATDGQLMLFEGQQSDHFQSSELWEVVVREIGAGEEEAEHVIGEEHFRDLEGGQARTFTAEGLPFELSLSDFVSNARVLPKGPRWNAVGPVVDGYGIQALAPDPEVGRNLPGIHAEVRLAGQSERGILAGVADLPWTFEAQGRAWAFELRRARYRMPFAIRLEKFEKEEHPGTGLAKAFRSEVTKIEEGNSERVLIQMNEPLRHGGLVLFQSSWGPQNARPGSRLYSVFSVVRNPSDKWPEYSLWVITFGLVLAFGRRLFYYLRDQTGRRAGDEGEAR